MNEVNYSIDTNQTTRTARSRGSYSILQMVGYKINDRGEHVVIVRYGDAEIPGSPFLVEA